MHAQQKSAGASERKNILQMFRDRGGTGIRNYILKHCSVFSHSLEQVDRGPVHVTIHVKGTICLSVATSLWDEHKVLRI